MPPFKARNIKNRRKARGAPKRRSGAASTLPARRRVTKRRGSY